MPCACAAAGRASSLHSAPPSSSCACNSPLPGSGTSVPGGGVRARALMALRSAAAHRGRAPPAWLHAEPVQPTFIDSLEALTDRLDVTAQLLRTRAGARAPAQLRTLILAGHLP